MARTISIPKQNRRVQDNPHETPVLSVQTTETYAQLTLTMDAADLVDPTAQWQVQIFESRDGGGSFNVAAAMTDQGKVGRTTPSMLQITGVELLRPMFGRLIVSRTMSIGATLEIG